MLRASSPSSPGGRVDVHGRRHASSQAAAAYRVLAPNFPQFAAKLAGDYQTSLALIPDGRAKDQGIAVGEAAAARIVMLRQGDGRGNPLIAYTRAPDVGVWRPTPPAMAPFAVVWMGFVRPLVLSSQTQIPLHGPDPLTSWRYARDFKEVHDFGSATGSARTPEQTENALFWSDNTPVQYQAGVRDLVQRHGLTSCAAPARSRSSTRQGPIRPSPAGAPSTTSPIGGRSRPSTRRPPTPTRPRSRTRRGRR
jgi:hypothetical protein